MNIGFGIILYVCRDDKLEKLNELISQRIPAYERAAKKLAGNAADLSFSVGELFMSVPLMFCGGPGGGIGFDLFPYLSLAE